MNKKDMIECLIKHYENGNKTRFAKRLGLSPQGISTWLSRGTIDFELVFANCENLNASWLLTGEGEMLLNKNSEKSTGGTAPIITPIEQNQSESVFKQMYLEEKREKEELIRENGRLEERIKTLNEDAPTYGMAAESAYINQRSTPSSTTDAPYPNARTGTKAGTKPTK